jgi:hypothetical protein
VLLAASALHCGGASDGAVTGDGAKGGPSAIQPQPIPEDGFANTFDLPSLTLAPSGSDLRVSGRALEPFGPSAAPGIGVSAFDATRAGPVVSQAADGEGRFSLLLPEGAVTDEVFLFFDGDQSGAASLLLRGGADAPAKSGSCVHLDGAFALELGELAVGEPRALSVVASGACGADVAVDKVSSVGALAATKLPQPFTASAAGARVSFDITPGAKGSIQGFLVLGEGAKRHVVTLHATAR